MWIVRSRPKQSAKLRLFCFPYAGGSAVVYRNWSDALGPDVEVCAVQFPGRTTRMRETPFTDLNALINALVPHLLSWLNKPFAFFGHSLGALVAFELTRALHTAGATEPIHLYISGRRSPQTPRTEPPIHALEDGLFINRLRELGGTPEEVLTDQSLLQILMPTLRADFSLNDTYTYLTAPQLNTPITAFAGEHDRQACVAQVSDWSRYTDGRFTLHTLPGGHFFVHEQESILLALLSASLGALHVVS
jgi:medium-chain acyl-[acyl-carrier-protein] hydrolase